MLFVRNLLGLLIPAGAMALVCAPLSRASRDEWRLLAWVPVLPLAGWALFLAIAITRDPTSHNLWPFELLLWGPLSLILLAAFLVARRVVGGPREDWVARAEQRGEE